MKHKQYLKYHIGKRELISHIDAVHAKGPDSDEYTGKIVLGVIRQIDASGIIATVSRNDMDINRPEEVKYAPAVNEYRETIREIIDSKNILDEKGKLNKKYLHLAIHGMANRSDKTEFEIGTSDGKSCSQQVVDWFTTNLSALSKKVVINKNFKGVKAKIEAHRKGDIDSNYAGYGDLFNTIQIEINRDWRENRQNDLINFFSEVILDFEKTFNSQ